MTGLQVSEFDELVNDLLPGYAEPVYYRAKLLSSQRIEGPAIIEEASSTTMLHAGDVLTVGAYGELVITTA